MPGTKVNQRKIIMINPEMQHRMIRAFVGIPAIGMASAMVVVCYFTYQVYREAIISDVRLDGLIPLFLSVSVFLIVTSVFLFSNSIKISHLVAGPAYRICQSIKQMRAGDIGFKIKLRAGDYLTEVRDELNLLLDTLNENPPDGFTTLEMKAAAEAEKAESEDGSLGDDRDQADARECVSAGAANSSTGEQ